MLMEQMGSKMIFFKGSLFLRVTQHKGLHLKWVGDSTEKILQKDGWNRMLGKIDRGCEMWAEFRAR